MKKLILISSTLAVLAGSSAFAKTEGNYVTVDLHKAISETHRNTLIVGGTTQDDITKYTGQNTSLGASYKYAFNFDKIFLAPGIFYERIGTKVTTGPDDANGSGPTMSVNNRRGVRLDLGYDFTNDFAAYVTTGITSTTYRTSHPDADALGTAQSNQKFRGNKTGYLYGIGFTTNVAKDVSIGAEYNTQMLKVKSLHVVSGSDIRFKNRIDLYKVTLAYHF